MSSQHWEDLTPHVDGNRALAWEHALSLPGPCRGCCGWASPQPRSGGHQRLLRALRYKNPLSNLTPAWSHICVLNKNEVMSTSSDFSYR